MAITRLAPAKSVFSRAILKGDYKLQILSSLCLSHPMGGRQETKTKQKQTNEGIFGHGAAELFRVVDCCCFFSQAAAVAGAAAGLGVDF